MNKRTLALVNISQVFFTIFSIAYFIIRTLKFINSDKIYGQEKCFP